MNTTHRLPRLLTALPCVFTIGNGGCGLAAIAVVVSHWYAPHEAVLWAAVLIGFGALLDALDGPLARRLGCASDTGAKLDALSDLVSFGTAPAVLGWYVITNWSLGEGGVLVPVIAGLYICCAALRLARFLASNRPGRIKAFRGLPTPAAAGLVVAAFLLAPTMDTPAFHRSALLALMLAVSLAMLSPFPYDRPLAWLRHPAGRLFAIVFLAAVVAGLMTWPRHTIAMVFGAYALTGPGVIVMGWLRALWAEEVEA